MLIDTHCHLDAASFAADIDQVIARAFANGVQAIVVPAVSVKNFALVKKLAHSNENIFYAVGIHPLFVADAIETDLDCMHNFLQQNINDQKLVAIGEIGLDFYLPELKTLESVAQQEKFYVGQLNLAQEFGLPVLLHVRKSQDQLLKYLRRKQGVKGIVHAFNGSFQQANQFLDLGFMLGMGGAMTFQRAKQIRRLATELPLSALVLETDAPDMAPEWLVAESGKDKARNEPYQVDGIAGVLASLRSISKAEVLDQSAHNAFKALPRLKLAMTKQAQN